MKLEPDYFKWAWRLTLISLFLIVIGIPSCKTAFASAVPKQPDIDECKYKPQRGDEVRQVCDFSGESKTYKLRGEGYVILWVCGEQYKIDITCPAIEAK